MAKGEGSEEEETMLSPQLIKKKIRIEGSRKIETVTVFISDV